MGLKRLTTLWPSHINHPFKFQAQSQYVLTTQQLQGGTVRQMGASQKGMTPSGGGRAHITLNPYSTQLVDNLNMMMPTAAEQRASHSMTMQPKLLGLTNSLKGGVHQQQQQQHMQQQLQQQQDE